MEARLIDEITQVLATLGLDSLGPASTASLRAASVEALGRQADRHEWLALLLPPPYRAPRRGRAMSRDRGWEPAKP
jgi:hypothetical protein